MLNFLSTFTNTNLAAFPDTEAVNSSGGAATDGTEFIAAMVNDSLWGWQQALLSSVGLTPNGITEAVGASQVMDALRKFTIPGMIIPVAWNDDPATLLIRAIQLTGQGILRSNYAELDDIVYVGDADNALADAFYHADDAVGVTRNTTGVYLILPDGRGRVVRGRDLTGAIDPDGVGTYLGSEQEDQFQGWQLGGSKVKTYYGYLNADDNAIGNSASANFGLPQYGTTNQGDASLLTAFDDGTNGPPRTGDQSRAKSILADYAITY